MSLFRDESPNLGPSTTEKELGIQGTVAHNEATYNYYKPTTRQFVNLEFDGVRNAGALTGWMFVAPWACQVISARIIQEVAATAAATLQCYLVPFASQPEAPSSGNAVFATAQQLSSATATANTVFLETINTTVSSNTLAPGDLLGYVLSAAITSSVGGLLQVELIQLG